MDLGREEQLDAELHSWLAFAVQKCAEVAVLTQAINQPEAAEVQAALAYSAKVQVSRAQSPRIHKPAVQARLAAITATDSQRHSAFVQRIEQQRARLQLPALSSVVRVCRLRRIDGRAVLYAEHYLNPRYFPDILEQDLAQSLTEIYGRVYGIEYGQVCFEILDTGVIGPVRGADTTKPAPTAPVGSAPPPARPPAPPAGRRSRRGVESQEVVHGRDAAHGRLVIESGVWPAPVVAVNEWLQGSLALS